MKNISKQQQGNILVMFTIGLFVLIAMSALALDGGHMLLNKSRLQNYVDASALNAAKVIDDGGNHAQARAAAIELFNINLAHSDAAEIANSFDISNLVVSFYHSPEDTTPAAETDETAKFVKVVVSDIDLSNFLAQIMSFNKVVSASALAGASTAIQYCFNDIVPMMVCGTPPPDPKPDNYTFGYDYGKLQIMKMDSNPDSQIGPGNFQLIRLGDSHGANEIREAMAGGNDPSANICFSSGSDDPDVDTTSEVPTEPGNTVGPVAQGLNTRFGEYHGPLNKDSHLYPRDPNACEGDRIELDDEGVAYMQDGGTIFPSVDDESTPIDESLEFYQRLYTHEEYESDNAPATQQCSVDNGDWDSTDAIAKRRIIRVVVGNCTEQDNGANSVEFLGVACFFLTQQTTQKGNESYVVGEFISNCTGNGWPSGNTTANGPHTLVLYHSQNSSDS
ncbi:TadE/TadG family type IV pilus assembly protein [Thalassomonas sp. M1454]|uniref:TadE/TadG family type IV pilus assembly protein n=1 Tax=Thalassomonas sp. M1454 TaxID=2594477 RepID=UPI0021B0B90C|nr:Tad domain-containing protein [Thalassomonas sp. M1454]